MLSIAAVRAAFEWIGKVKLAEPESKKENAKGMPIAHRPGEVTMQRVVGSVVRAQGLEMETSREFKKGRTYEALKMTEETRAVLDVYNAARVEKTGKLVPVILDDVVMYGKLYDEHGKKTEPGVFERLANIEKQLPQKAEGVDIT